MHILLPPKTNESPLKKIVVGNLEGSDPFLLSEMAPFVMGHSFIFGGVLHKILTREVKKRKTLEVQSTKESGWSLG